MRGRRLRLASDQRLLAQRRLLNRRLWRILVAEGVDRDSASGPGAQ